MSAFHDHASLFFRRESNFGRQTRQDFIVFTNIKISTGLKKSLKMATDPVRETQCVKRQYIRCKKTHKVNELMCQASLSFAIFTD